MQVVLISTYELGRQPFGLASPAAWLRREGATVTCLDLAKQSLRAEPIRSADLVAFYLPMHTATRIAVGAIERIKRLKPEAHLCCYGLYAPVNAEYLRGLGVHTLIGGEFEGELVGLIRRLRDRPQAKDDSREARPTISLQKQKFLVPEREGLLPLSHYARLRTESGQHRTVGYTEASRGCLHLCRHCPVVPVYEGQFRIVQLEVVLEDIRRQVAGGAEHITFGDPDFFNGPGHSLAIVEKLHEEHPKLTYDVTIKIEHLLKHSRHLSTLRDTGCLFVTSAVESVDDRVLELLQKHHTREDFFEVVRRFRKTGLTLAPTFVAFTPWTSLEGYRELLSVLAELDLVENVAPIQLAIRLLIPAGSKLLELSQVWDFVEGFDRAALSYRWQHPDPRVECLQAEVLKRVKKGEAAGRNRREIFSSIWGLAGEAAGTELPHPPVPGALLPRAAIPYMDEPWYC
ncbi:MAG: CUAEP/CCAEP-tail radical SAM protein [Acidobacteria bacterium]|nr:CUAEP/CCAEP-tail radical SAM protein [Acidobacteriota bacterium]